MIHIFNSIQVNLFIFFILLIIVILVKLLFNKNCDQLCDCYIVKFLFKSFCFLILDFLVYANVLEFYTTLLSVQI